MGLHRFWPQTSVVDIERDVDLCLRIFCLESCMVMAYECKVVIPTLPEFCQLCPTASDLA